MQGLISVQQDTHAAESDAHIIFPNHVAMQVHATAAIRQMVRTMAWSPSLLRSVLQIGEGPWVAQLPFTTVAAEAAHILPLHWACAAGGWAAA